MTKLLPMLVALFGFALTSTSFAQTAATKEFLPPLPAGKEWKLIWNDEFDGPKLDETKWNRRGDHVRKGGWWVKEDAYLSGTGTLMLRTKKDGDRFTCGALDTNGKFEHAFGYYVARLKMPKQPGHWPAFWLQSPSMTKVGDEGRDGTEIDIVEIPWRRRATIGVSPARSSTARTFLKTR
jgi:beta-glucanase (GH16 family)